MFKRFFVALGKDFIQALTLVIICIPLLIVVVPIVMLISLLPAWLVVAILIGGWTLYFNWDYIRGGK